MGELGDLLEVLHGVRDRRSSLVVEFRDWRNPQPSAALVAERDETMNSTLRWRGRGPWPRPLESRRRIWLVYPDRLRVEIRRREQLTRLGVRTGLDWWRWDRDYGAWSGSATGGEPHVLPPLLNPALVWPARLVGLLWLERDGFGVRASREVIRARAWPRQLPPSSAGLTYELEFDAEHGTVLRRATFEDGCCIQVTEAQNVSYDTPIDPERFIFVSPDGRPAQPFEPSVA